MLPKTGTMLEYTYAVFQSNFSNTPHYPIVNMNIGSHASRAKNSRGVYCEDQRNEKNVTERISQEKEK